MNESKTNDSGANRKISNPLALAAMGLLNEQPMHAYEMVSEMRKRHLHEVIRLRYGSLYTVVEALLREALIAPLEIVREGRRPERTVYNLTEKGKLEFLAWLRELLRYPVEEHAQFAAGLSFALELPPDETSALLEERVSLLEGEVGKMHDEMESRSERGLPRAFLIEHEHKLMLREAELGWVRGLSCEIRAGTLEGMREWRSLHTAPEDSDVADTGVGATASATASVTTGASENPRADSKEVRGAEP